jgi:hypothetical protein
VNARVALLDRAPVGQDTNAWLAVVHQLGMDGRIFEVPDSLAQLDLKEFDPSLIVLASRIGTRVPNARRADLFGDLEILSRRYRMANFSAKVFDKLVVQQTLTDLGFLVPDTAIVANLTEAHELLESRGDLVFKPRFGHAGLGVMAARSSRNTDVSLPRLRGRTEAQLWHLLDNEGPLMAQSRIAIKDEYRVIVVQSKIVRAFRATLEPPIFRSTAEIPKIASGLETVPAAFGLPFAEIDAVRSTDGRLFVLDVNPVLNIGFWERLSDIDDAPAPVRAYLETHHP